MGPGQAERRAGATILGPGSKVGSVAFVTESALEVSRRTSPGIRRQKAPGFSQTMSPTSPLALCSAGRSAELTKFRPPCWLASHAPPFFHNLA